MLYIHGSYCLNLPFQLSTAPCLQHHNDHKSSKKTAKICFLMLVVNSILCLPQQNEFANSQWDSAALYKMSAALLNCRCSNLLLPQSCFILNGLCLIPLLYPTTFTLHEDTLSYSQQNSMPLFQKSQD